MRKPCRNTKGKKEMKRQNKQAVAAATVKAANNEATEVEALNNEVAVKKATYPQKSKTKKAPSW